jgi:tRNA nucleotidyltransferase (CCA-adding enzyme)
MQTYLVGGAVRDQLLQLPVHERDWVVVGATAQQLLDQGYQGVGKDFPVFLHPQTKEEYALARTERKSGKGYTGFDCYASPDVTLEQDLMRRDLTINAIAQDSQGRLIDPYHGQEDIQKKLLRHVSPAFTEDPLRVLRLARFLARFAHLGFTISDETIALATQISRSGELETIAAERIWRELEKTLHTQTPSAFFLALDQVQASDCLMPELKNLDQETLTRLDSACTNKYSAPVCFAVLFARKDQQQTQNLCGRLKTPKEFTQLALLVSQWANDTAEDLTAEYMLNLLENTDAFRRPDRFNAFLQCCKVIDNNNVRQQKLQQALNLCNAIDIKAIAAQGFKGKAIANKIREQRLENIKAI